MSDDFDDFGPEASLDFWGEKLDAGPIMAVVPMKASKPKRKGDPLGPAREGKVPVAKFGTCIFFTGDVVLDRDPSAHVQYILDAIQAHTAEIMKIKQAQEIEWSITVFEGSRDNEKLKDVDPVLMEAARELGIPVEVRTAY